MTQRRHLSHAAFLCGFGGFLCGALFCVRTLAKFGFGSERIGVRWFGFGGPRFLGWLRGAGGRGRETLSARAGLEDVYILDPSTPHFRRIGTGGSYLKVNFLNPPR